MNFYKIVITGGPCAGKTTGLSIIEQELTKIGYKVVMLNEIATEMILGNLNANSFKNNLDFEISIIQLQLENERVYEEICHRLPDEKVILLCDRGIMDTKAYMSGDEFSEALKILGKTEVELRNNYSAVFHLVTAADGAREHYTRANNLARRENADEAIKADKDTMKAWEGHPHFRVVDNSTDFATKMHRLVNEICVFLEEPNPFEIKSKYLIKYPDTKLLEGMPNCKKVEIVQTYLTPENSDEERRVRQRGENGNNVYTYTKAKTISPEKCIETESKITESEYLALLEETDKTKEQIRKTRYCLVSNNKYFEIDIYPNNKETAICEIEQMSSTSAPLSIPAFITILKPLPSDEDDLKTPKSAIF